MQDAPTMTTSPLPACAGCGCELELPPAIRALVELLGEEPVCAACHTDTKEA
jgi:hypothetical protein